MTKVNVPMSEEMLEFVLDVVTIQYLKQTFDPSTKAKDLNYTRQILQSLQYYRKNFN